MDRRKFLALSGMASVGFGASLIPTSAHAATTNTALNAQGFGLKPNSSNDQSTVFQAAIHQATAQKLPLFIPAGSYIVSDIYLPDHSHIIGANKQSILVQTDNAPIFFADNANNINIDNISFEGNLVADSQSKILSINNSKNLNIEQCQIYNGDGNGLELINCSGQVIACQFHNLGQSAIHSTNGRVLKIMRNEIFDIGNNGVLIWQEDKADDGSIVSHNHIYKIRTDDGGSGQNGNGINVYKANNVIMSDNQFNDCAYSAVRINDGNNCQIINNHCTNIGEVALYAEFGFNGVMINNNLVDTAGAGISVANLDQKGHLAICKGNLLRNLTLRAIATENDDSRAYGIAAEADALIEGNIIENASNFGIGGGYGEYQRNISVVNNMVKDCGYGITASVVQGAGKMTISNNSIHNASKGAIVGFAWDEAVTDELVEENQKFGEGSQENLNIQGNVVI